LGRFQKLTKRQEDSSDMFEVPLANLLEKGLNVDLNDVKIDSIPEILGDKRMDLPEDSTSEVLELIDVQKAHTLRRHQGSQVCSPKCRSCDSLACLKCISCDGDLYCSKCFERIHYHSKTSNLAFFAHHKSILLDYEINPSEENTHIIDSTHSPQTTLVKEVDTRINNNPEAFSTSNPLFRPIPSSNEQTDFLYPSLR
jgi:hypothetical protein